jgi:AraC-like DNA-binding protein
MINLFENILNHSLRFEYVTGDLTTQHQPIHTEWRSLPCLLVAYQKNGKSGLYLKNHPFQVVERNELLVIPSGMQHLITLESSSMTSYWVHLNYYVLGRLDFFTFVSIPTILRGKMAENIGEIIKKWILFLKNTTAENFIETQACKNEMGFHILRELSSLIKSSSENQTRLKYIHQIQPALDEIHHNYTAAIDRNILANYCNISTSQFHRIFVKAMSIGPMEYIRSLRINRAQSLLISTDFSVKEICRLSGYNDPFIFSRAFKQKCGLSPDHYRRNFNLSTQKNNHVLK